MARLKHVKKQIIDTICMVYLSQNTPCEQHYQVILSTNYILAFRMRSFLWIKRHRILYSVTLQ